MIIEDKEKIKKSGRQPKATCAYTYSDVDELNSALQRMKNENIVSGNNPFKSANIQNRVLLRSFAAEIREVKEEPAGWEDYQKKLYELQQKHVQKFDDGSIKFFRFENSGEEKEVRTQDNGSYTKWNDDKLYATEFAKLKEEYAVAIKAKEEQPRFIREFMAKEVANLPALHKVHGPFDKNFPEAILDVLVRFDIIDINELK